MNPPPAAPHLKDTKTRSDPAAVIFVFRIYVSWNRVERSTLSDSKIINDCVIIILRARDIKKIIIILRFTVVLRQRDLYYCNLLNDQQIINFPIVVNYYCCYYYTDDRFLIPVVVYTAILIKTYNLITHE